MLSIGPSTCLLFLQKIKCNDTMTILKILRIYYFNYSVLINRFPFIKKYMKQRFIINLIWKICWLNSIGRQFSGTGSQSPTYSKYIDQFFFLVCRISRLGYIQLPKIMQAGATTASIWCIAVLTTVAIVFAVYGAHTICYKKDLS